MVILLDGTHCDLQSPRGAMKGHQHGLPSRTQTLTRQCWLVCAVTNIASRPAAPGDFEAAPGGERADERMRAGDLARRRQASRPPLPLSAVLRRQADPMT
jgi:hypothetical protein